MNILEQWQLGYMTIIGLLFFPMLYLLVRQFRRFGAWTNREEAPKERAYVYVVALTLLRIFVGGLSQSSVDLGVACHNAGENIILCIFKRSI